MQSHPYVSRRSQSRGLRSHCFGGGADKLRTALGDERAARAQADEKPEQRVEDIAAGGLDFEGVGVWWVVIGALLGTFPGELVRVLQWP